MSREKKMACRVTGIGRTGLEFSTNVLFDTPILWMWSKANDIFISTQSQ